MTQDEWSKVEKTLTQMGSIVTLNIDDYRVNIIVTPIKPLQNALTILIDGKFNVKWLFEDCEIRRKFCQKHKHNLLSAKKKEELRKLCKNKKAFENALQTYSYYVYYNEWTSFKSMKLHFVKNCNEIALAEQKN